MVIKHIMINFTRYLYIKDEVKLALLLAILEKKEESIFWAYELYYTTNKSDEIFDFLWQIYFDFFAIINPSFELYFLTKQKQHEQNKEQENEKIISMIVQDLLIRNYSTDAFMMKIINIDKKIEPKTNNNKKKLLQNIEDWIKIKDYKTICNFIINYQNEQYEIIYEIFLDLLCPIKKPTLLKQFHTIIKFLYNKIDAKYILLTKILSLLQTNTNLNKKNKNDRSFYIQVQPEEIIMYNLDYDDIKPYNILKHTCIFKINDYKFFPLFELQRYKLHYSEVKDIYHNDWLFYASLSPIWEKRIKVYNGTIDIDKKYVIFLDDEQEELFNNKYNYEPDEQSLDLKNKTTPEIIKYTDNELNWNQFQQTYNKNGFLNINPNELLLSLSNKQIYY